MSFFFCTLRCVILSSALALLGTGSVYAECQSWLNYSATKLHDSESLDFCSLSGKVILAVNTASRCGFTPQFTDLDALYKKYSDQGLIVVGFPSNDFLQEYSSSEKTAEVCYLNYGVSFPMLEKSAVRGDRANDFFKWLAAETGKKPTWNFNKYLIAPDGSVAHFGSRTKPLGGTLERDVIAALALVPR